MRRGVARVTQALVVALLAGAATAHAQALSIGPSDIRVVEGIPGTVQINLSVTLSGPNMLGPTTVSWATVAGSAALVDPDFVFASGSVTFPMGSVSPQPVTVYVQGDLIDEWSPTLQQDEVFFVDLSNPIGATIDRGRATVTIVDDDHDQPGLQFVSAVSDSTGTGATDGRNRLQWRVPPAPTPPVDILIRWNSSLAGSACSAPASDVAPAENEKILTPNPPMTLQSWTHDSVTGPGQVLVPRVYCYSLFTRYPALTAERVEVVTRTFDTFTGPVKWAYAAGYRGGFPPVNVMPPTVGPDAVYTVGTDGVVHAMERGPLGGPWPATWNPLALGRPAHNRSPVAQVRGAWRLFVGTESGEVHSIDGRTGTLAWSRSQLFQNTQLMTGSIGTQATPAALLKNYGGQNDLILVGTATSVGNTRFFALDPTTGADIDFYPNGPIGPSDSPPGPIDNVYGMAVVDYAGNRVFFGTAGAAFTLWSLDLGSMGAPNLTRSETAWNPASLGSAVGTMGAPVFRNGRLYLGTDSGAAATVHSLRVSDGNLRSYTHGDGEAKGFLWPDRRNDRLYFSTPNMVHAVRDNDATGLTEDVWGTPLTLTSPSIVLQRPGFDELYVGDGTGRLVRIDANSGSEVSFVTLEPGKQLGAPSLDNSYELVLVGSETGAVYAVRVGF